MKLALAAACISALSTQALAADWWLVAITKDRQGVFVDRGSITDASTVDHRMKAASAQVLAGSGAGAPTARRFTAYFECNSRYSGPGSSIFRDMDGAAPSGATNTRMAAALAPATPGSGDSQAILFGCKEGRIIEGEAQYSINGVDFFQVEDPAASLSAYLSYSGGPN